MTEIDWIIIALTLGFALYGYGQGFIVGALALVGFGAGAFLGARFGPHLIPDGSESPYAPLFGLGGALTVGSVLATGFAGVGWGIRGKVRSQSAGVVDGLLGSALTACVALGLSWILGAVALQTPGATELRRDIQRSSILRELNDVLPPSGPILNALARFDPFPRIDAPGARVAPPPPGIPRDPQVRAAAPSLARILGDACGLGVAGSGWVAADDIVVTNAHVVAGSDDTTVQPRGEGPKYDAEAIAFDPTNDVAVLRVPGMPASRPLPLADDPEAGTPAAVLGFPKNGPYDSQPGRLGQTRTVVSQDAYERGPIQRRMTSFRGRVRPGNSGGPMVDGEGRVVTTVFAATISSAQEGGFGVPNDIVRETLDGARGRVSTGPCVG